ncbi:GMP/IMP nucleotidase [Endozoicomonas sp. SM1973]|uniref:GMP/IMP nucleotidase n=1 Tax=Spartinivicinus marinus TaxID=2994442 RepID=A0A853HY07_9GAMM|nr:GMP/IMP nucleotidase [Spartinivicinus marinus]MCX4027196.1 GMP/IMP nucleotidase [Spartinivicinus marinus]NYZ66083.1 GMP/IMP nucleotidase [Spartinivicinus marinus]
MSKGDSMLDWQQIDTVLLDMDGTLLDLHFDNHFWLEHVPVKYAEKHQLSIDEAKHHIYPKFEQMMGKLEWYCLDYWNQELDLNMVELKQEIKHLITLRPGADEFLRALHQSNKQVVLITNAHQDSLSLKLERVELAQYFDLLISSHEFGYPKEEQLFWQGLSERIAFDGGRTLFIDDSLPILRSAKEYGVKHLLAIKQPDSTKELRDTEEFEAVTNYHDLLPV